MQVGGQRPLASPTLRPALPCETDDGLDELPSAEAMNLFIESKPEIKSSMRGSGGSCMF